MSAPTVADFNTPTVAGPVTSFTRTITSTFASNDLYVIAVFARSATLLPTVVTITANGLLAIPMANPLTYPSAPGQFSTTNLTGSLWGIANLSGMTISNPTMTVVLSASADNVQYASVTMAGLFDPTKPLDLKNSGRYNAQGQGTQNITYSTTNAHDTLIFLACENSASGFTTAPPTGWTNISVAFGDPDCTMAYKTFSSPQTNQVVATGQRSDSGGISFVVALTGDAGGGPLTFCGSIPNPPV